MTLDVQWFIFALVSNGALSQQESGELYDKLGEPDLAAYAQAVLDKLAAGLSAEDSQSILEQIQAVVDYAVEQAETGLAPEMAPVEEKTSPAPAAASAAPAHEEAKVPHAQKERTGIVQDKGIKFEAVDIDLSQINSFEDLPDLRNAASLSDADAAKLMITLLTCLRKLGASDLHLSANAKPFVRRKLEIERFADYILSAEDAKKLNLALLSEDRRNQFMDSFDLNLALEVGRDRFRVALMMHKDGMEGSYRLVPDHICTLEELGFLDHDIVHIKRLLDYNNGLILLTGPIGSGKTTTLGTVVNLINEKRSDHIITVEDPIEIVQLSKNCQVTQREIGKHTISYRTALKAALREDPDVIVIGEMHDLETIENAITAAETGHLVIGTLHTGNAANTLNRLLDVFPPSQQPQIRAMTAGSLRGIICQRLLPDTKGGLTIAYEILVNTMSVASVISEGKTFRLKSTMQTGSKQGMCILDQCLLEKYQLGQITYETALSNMTDATAIGQIKQMWAVEQAKALAANMKKK